MLRATIPGELGRLDWGMAGDDALLEADSFEDIGFDRFQGHILGDDF